MADIALGQVWEIYSDRERRWVRAVIAKQEDEQVTLRYEGSLELITVNAEDLHNDSAHFRVVSE